MSATHPDDTSQTTRDPAGTSTGLNELLRHPDLWRADRLEASRETVATGHAELDGHLPGGGWPRAGLAELLLPTAGVGELRLLLPLIRQSSQEQARWVVWIDPPFVPYAPALAAAGVDIRKMLLIHPRNHREALWALERASRSGVASLALAWLDERELEPADTRRLQVAARQGNTLTTLFRPESAAAAPSMAALRLRLHAAADAHGMVTVDILKRRGGWPVEGLRACLGEETQPREVHEQLSLWREYRRHLPWGRSPDRALESAPTVANQQSRNVPAPLPAAPSRSRIH